MASQGFCLPLADRCTSSPPASGGAVPFLHLRWDGSTPGYATPDHRPGGRRRVDLPANMAKLGPPWPCPPAAPSASQGRPCARHGGHHGQAAVGHGGPPAAPRPPAQSTPLTTSPMITPSALPAQDRAAPPRAAPAFARRGRARTSGATRFHSTDRPRRLAGAWFGPDPSPWQRLVHPPRPANANMPSLAANL